MLARIGSAPPAGGDGRWPRPGRVRARSGRGRRDPGAARGELRVRADDLDAGALSEGAAAFGDFDTPHGRWRQRPDRPGARVRARRRGQLSAPVSDVALRDGEVRVIAGGRGCGRRRCRDRGPASVLDAISFDPPLPAGKAAVRYGQVAKLFVALNAPAPPSQTLSVPSATGATPSSGPTAIRCRSWRVRGHARRARDARRRSAGPAGGSSRCGGCARTSISTRTSVVALDVGRRSVGARRLLGAVGDARRCDTDALARRSGRCSSPASTPPAAWHGLMEGALRSGERAAQQLLQTALR